MKPEERLKHATETFASLALPDWRLSNQSVSPGGQTGVCAVIREDGTMGVFRCLLPSPSPEAVHRFTKEVSVINGLDHEHIVKLLKFSINEPHWYISELAENFKTYWHRFISSAKRSQIESTALDIIRKLASGLGECHSRGIIHRDIKPNNIVIFDRDGCLAPVVIDFGVVWTGAEDRLTEEGDAVGNARYAPDLLRRRSDDCPPWVDVFSLVQMFQWMMAEREGKHYWQRPTHWRFVGYPDDSTASFVKSLRAISASTSCQETSPQDGHSLVRLLDSLFVDSGHPPELPPPDSQVKYSIAAGRCRKLIREANDKEIVDASREMARIVYGSLQELLKDLSQLPYVKVHASHDLDELFRDECYAGTEETMLALICEVPDGGSFRVEMRISVRPPSRWPEGKRPEWLEEMNVFLCWVGYGDMHPYWLRERVQHKYLHLSIHQSGNLISNKPSWSGALEPMPKQDVQAWVRSLLLDADLWEEIAAS